MSFLPYHIAFCNLDGLPVLLIHQAGASIHVPAHMQHICQPQFRVPMSLSIGFPGSKHASIIKTICFQGYGVIIFRDCPEFEKVDLGG